MSCFYCRGRPLAARLIVGAGVLDSPLLLRRPGFRAVYFMLSQKFALANLHGNETNLVIDKLGVAVADGARHDIRL